MTNDGYCVLAVDAVLLKSDKSCITPGEEHLISSDKKMTTIYLLGSVYIYFQTREDYVEFTSVSLLIDYLPSLTSKSQTPHRVSY
jgi:hypothetical protein